MNDALQTDMSSLKNHPEIQDIDFVTQVNRGPFDFWVFFTLLGFSGLVLKSFWRVSLSLEKVESPNQPSSLKALNVSNFHSKRMNKKLSYERNS